MKRSRATAFVAAALFAALWACSLARAISFYRCARGYFSETNSINSLNDLRYSTWLLGCYLISLLATFGFVWLLSRRPHFLLVVPGVLLVIAVGEVHWLRPETPIHLFPSLAPFGSMLTSITALAIAAIFVYLSRTRRQQGID